MPQPFSVKVYYEDTDSMGLVYHANYLRFFERARTELFGELGRSVADWHQDGYLFAVYRIDITFRRAARLGDLCRVETELTPQRSAYRISLLQSLYRQEQLLTEADVELVCLDQALRLRAFPPEILGYLQEAKSPEQ